MHIGIAIGHIGILLSSTNSQNAIEIHEWIETQQTAGTVKGSTTHLNLTISAGKQSCRE